MKNPALFIGALVVAVVALALGIYYLIPGIYHPLTFSSAPTDAHLKHAVAFFALCVLLIVVALVNRPKPAVR
jgi:hypothetical protein